MALSISLTPQLEEAIRARIASGMYSSASEVIREALRLLEEYDQLRGKRLEALRADLQSGVKSGKGRKVSAADIIKKARATKAGRK